MSRLSASCSEPPVAEPTWGRRTLDHPGRTGPTGPMTSAATVTTPAIDSAAVMRRRRSSTPRAPAGRAVRCGGHREQQEVRQRGPDEGGGAGRPADDERRDPQREQREARPRRRPEADRDEVHGEQDEQRPADDEHLERDGRLRRWTGDVGGDEPGADEVAEPGDRLAVRQQLQAPGRSGVGDEEPDGRHERADERRGPPGAGRGAGRGEHGAEREDGHARPAPSQRPGASRCPRANRLAATPAAHRPPASQARGPRRTSFIEPSPGVGPSTSSMLSPGSAAQECQPARRRAARVTSASRRRAPARRGTRTTANASLESATAARAARPRGPEGTDDGEHELAAGRAGRQLGGRRHAGRPPTRPRWARARGRWTGRAARAGRCRCRRPAGGPGRRRTGAR